MKTVSARMMMASVVAMELYDSNLNAESLVSVSEFVISKAGSATGGSPYAGQVGLVEERITRANDTRYPQKTLLETLLPSSRLSIHTKHLSN
jgi:hypothetical protein